jgi:hypothetical protein
MNSLSARVSGDSAAGLKFLPREESMKQGSWGEAGDSEKEIRKNRGKKTVPMSG